MQPTPTFAAVGAPLELLPAVKPPQSAITLDNAAQVAELVRWETVTGCDLMVCVLAISPDGSLLAVSTGVEGQPQGVYLYDLQNLRGLWYLPADPASLLIFSPDSSLLVEGSGQVWDTRTGEPYMKFEGIGEGNEVWLASFSADGSRLAVSTKDGLQLWDFTSGEVKIVTNPGNVGIYSLSISPDGGLIAAAFNQGTLVIIDANADLAEPIATLDIGNRWVSSVAFSPDGQTLAAGTTDGKALILNASNLEILQTLYVTDAFWVTGVAFSPDGKILVAGEMSVMKLFNTVDGAELTTLEIEGGFQDLFTFTNDSRSLFLISAQMDTMMIEWFGIP